MSAGGGRGRSRLALVVSAALATAVVASAALLCTLAAGTALDQWRLAPVLSGSMEPEIPKGAMVLAEPVEVNELRAGDVLLFNAPSEGHPLVVHRVFDVEHRRLGPVFHTKGDANDAPDVWTIRINGKQAWRVRHVAPVVGSAVGLLSDAGARMLVLVLGVVMLTLWGLRALWALRPISWRADDPFGEERRRTARRASARAAMVGTVGVLLVGLLGAMGLAYAQFTATAPPPAPGLASGSLPTPTDPSCRWASTTSVALGWTAVAPDFATGYDIQRGDTSGGPYASIGTTSIVAPTTFTDTAAGPPTLRHYVVTSDRGTWDSPASAELVSNACIGAIRLVAGTSTGFSGDGGQATSARLAAPRGVAVDASGNVFIADTTNNRIRRVDAATGVITTVAGGGSNTACTYSGAATTVSLRAPRGVAVDSSGSVYIADTGRNCIRSVSGGTVNQVAGGGASTACTFSGAATAVSLSTPAGVEVDASGRVIVSDGGRRCARLVSGATVSQLAGTGTSGSTGDNGPAVGALFTTPAAVTADASGDVWIADAGTHRVQSVEGPL
jgi:signal peptidase I